MYNSVIIILIDAYISFSKIILSAKETYLYGMVLRTCSWYVVNTGPLICQQTCQSSTFDVSVPRVREKRRLTLMYTL